MANEKRDLMQADLAAIGVKFNKLEDELKRNDTYTPRVAGLMSQIRERKTLLARGLYHRR
jgi:hypothetical protein